MAWAEYGAGPKGQAKGSAPAPAFQSAQGLSGGCPDNGGPGERNRRLARDAAAGPDQCRRPALRPESALQGDRAGGRLLCVSPQRASGGALGGGTSGQRRGCQGGSNAPGLGHLGATEKLHSIRLRLVEWEKEGHHLLLATNHPAETLSAELVALLYRRRSPITDYLSSPGPRLRELESGECRETKMILQYHEPATFCSFCTSLTIKVAASLKGCLAVSIIR